MSEILGMDGAAPGEGAGDDLIKDATIESFEKDVLEASMTAPVIVDFWATWCQPCKALTPVLEKAVRDASGAVKLVKVDIDQNQMLASQLRIQSVPTVYGFFQGRPVDGFQGAVPESEIKAFIDRLTALTGGENAQAGAGLDEVLDAAEAAFEAGEVAAAAQAFSQVAQASQGGEAANIRALAGLAKCHISLRDFDQARQVFQLIPEEKQGDATVASVKAALDLAEAETDAGDTAALASKVANQTPTTLMRGSSLPAHISPAAIWKQALMSCWRSQNATRNGMRKRRARKFSPCSKRLAPRILLHCAAAGVYRQYSFRKRRPAYAARTGNPALRIAGGSTVISAPRRTVAAGRPITPQHF